MIPGCLPMCLGLSSKGPEPSLIKATRLGLQVDPDPLPDPSRSRRISTPAVATASSKLIPDLVFGVACWASSRILLRRWSWACLGPPGVQHPTRLLGPTRLGIPPSLAPECAGDSRFTRLDKNRRGTPEIEVKNMLWRRCRLRHRPDLVDSDRVGSCPFGRLEDADSL